MSHTPWLYLSIICQFLKPHYKLMPYFYTLAWEVTQKGYPPVRPMFGCDRQDPVLWDVADEN
ncbi:MAG TPA: hypothetical protein V6C63_01950 [Allocoleopsis sp.]